jgi:NADPH2:quinone reductase
MNAVVFRHAATDSSATAVLDVATPVPAATEVTIEVVAAGVNFLDVMARRGDPGYVPAWPFVPGVEVAGTVRDVGASVEGLAPGQLVVAFTGKGGLAEVAVADASLVAPVPGALDPLIAVAAPAAIATAVLLVTEAARVRPGESILVQSASGGVGQAVAAVARRSGAARVLGVVGSADRVPDALAAGYDAVFVRGAGLAEEVGHVDAILHTQGTQELDAALAMAAPGARIVLMGNASGAPLGPLPAAGRLFAGNVSIGGFSLSGLARTAPRRVGAAIRTALELLEDGTIELETDVHHGLAAAVGVHDRLARGGSSGKHVVVPQLLPGTAIPDS